jgi:hypothetical protein
LESSIGSLEKKYVAVCPHENKKKCTYSLAGTEENQIHVDGSFAPAPTGTANAALIELILLLL